MDIMRNQNVGTRFDFDSGVLLESPCKRCNQKLQLPACIKACELISGIQSVLSGGISSTLNFSPDETYSVGSLD